MNRLLSIAKVSATIAVTEARINGNVSTPIPVLSSAPKLSATLDIKRAKLQTIERARQAHGISQEKLAAEANLSSRWYRDGLKHPSRMSDASIAALTAALRRLQARAKPDPAVQAALIKTTYAGFLIAVCKEAGLNLAAVKADDPKITKSGDPEWLERSRARQMALYLTNQAVGVRQAPLARALGLTPSAVCQALQNIEDLRDNSLYDRIIDQASRDLTDNGI